MAAVGIPGGFSRRRRLRSESKCALSMAAARARVAMIGSAAFWWFDRRCQQVCLRDGCCTSQGARSPRGGSQHVVLQTLTSPTNTGSGQSRRGSTAGAGSTPSCRVSCSVSLVRSAALSDPTCGGDPAAGSRSTPRAALTMPTRRPQIAGVQPNAPRANGRSS
jgi:hypothetical protein